MPMQEADQELVVHTGTEVHPGTVQLVGELRGALRAAVQLVVQGEDERRVAVADVPLGALQVVRQRGLAQQVVRRDRAVLGAAALGAPAAVATDTVASSAVFAPAAAI
jgi:hypothetical protein